MTGKLHRLVWLIIAAWTVSAGFLTNACADVTVTSVANPVRASVNDRISVAVTVSGADALSAGAPILDDTPDFTVIGPSGTSQQISIVNGQTSAAKTYHYTFIPERTGVFTIGGAKVNADGAVYEARGTRVEVVDSGAAPPTDQPEAPAQGTREQSASGSENLFIQASVDRQKAYVGQQITYTFELYSRLGNLRDTEYEPPSTTGFWSVNLPDVPVGSSVVDNLLYRVSTVKTALFPTTSGEFTIGPAKLSYTTGGFFSAVQGRTLATDPISITVNPLPEQGRPADFSGAVGDFRIDAVIDRTELTTDDVATLRLTVTGTGNIDMISGLSEPDLSGFRSYDPKISKTISNSGYRVGGGKTWEYILMPQSAGETVIGPFAVSFFDPESETYRLVETEPVRLVVTPGQPSGRAGIASSGEQAPLSNAARDIRYIKPDKTSLSSVTGRFYARPLFFGFYAVPLFVFMTALVIKRRRDTIERDTGLRRRLRAWKHAQEGFAMAGSLMRREETRRFCGSLQETVTGYLADMLNLEAGVLTSATLEHIAERHGISSGLTDRLRKVLELCDFVRFSSEGADADIQRQLLDDAQSIVAALREELKG